MTAKNLSTLATDVIEISGITATNVVNAYRFGGERLIGVVDKGFVKAVAPVGSAFGKALRSSLIGGQKRVSDYVLQGLHLGTDGAQRAIGVAVDLASKSVGLWAANAVRVDRASKLNALGTFNRVAMPAAQLVQQVAERLEDGSGQLVRSLSGKAVPVKAVATRKLNAATRRAAATRKQLTKAATRNVKRAVDKVVAGQPVRASSRPRRAARKTQAAA